MAYDPATGNVVLFGGNDDAARSSDTWTWNGTTWTQQSPATSPPPAVRRVDGLRPGHRHVVLFGGQGNTTMLDDTWTWG